MNKKYLIVSTAKLHNEMLNNSLAASFSTVPVNLDSSKMVIAVNGDKPVHRIFSGIKLLNRAEVRNVLKAADWQVINASTLAPLYDVAKRQAFLDRAAIVELNASPVIDERTSDGYSKMAAYEPEGEFDSVVSHDFTDETTWPATNDSTFKLAPTAGKKLEIKKAEVQFSHDINFAGGSNLHFEIWVYNPADLPNKVKYEERVYKSVRDVVDLGNDHYTMPPVDGVATSITTVQFNYARMIQLKSSQGAELRCRISDDTPYSGTYCSITFTVSEVDE